MLVSFCKKELISLKIQDVSDQIKKSSLAFISSQRLLEILLTFLPLHPTITGCLIRLACQKFKLAQLTCATLTKKKLNPGHFFKPPQTKLHKHF